MSTCVGRGALLRVAGVSVRHWLCFGIFCVLELMDVYSVLAPLGIAYGAEGVRDAIPSLNLFPYTFNEGTISHHPASAPLEQSNVSGERFKDLDLLMEFPEFCEGIAGCRTLKKYLCKTWKQFTDASEDLADSSTMAEQDALIEEEKIVRAEAAAAVVHAVYVDAYKTSNKDEGWEVRNAVGLEEVERVGVKRKHRELQSVARRGERFRRRAPRRLCWQTSCTVVLMQTRLWQSAQLVLILKEEAEDRLENMEFGYDGSRKAFADAQVKENQEVTLVCWISCATRLKRAKTKCYQNVASGSWNESKCALSSKKGILVTSSQRFCRSL